MTKRGVGKRMLNKERIRLMTQLASYEQGKGKEYMPVSQYYRKDYVGLQMIKTFICATISFGILFALSLLYQMDTLEETFYQVDYVEYAVILLIKYLVFVGVYLIIAGVLYSYRYKKAHKYQKVYHNKLKKVQKLYEREETLLPIDDWDE